MLFYLYSFAFAIFIIRRLIEQGYKLVVMYDVGCQLDKHIKVTLAWTFFIVDRCSAIRDWFNSCHNNRC